ncbi:hypothetical protein S83_066555 [Arachis hypogaea]
MQSSPNKVLQSIKKCVQQLALVRPNVSFKVIDVERDDELFCTQIASSPLALLTSGFEEEVSSFLQALEVENDIIKLSGYVSGPCNALNMKDWDSILNFIEKFIKECWEENIDCGESFNQSTYRVHKDQPWEDLNILPTEADKSKFGSHTKNSQEHSVSTSGKLTEDEYHQSDREDVRTSLGYLCQGTEILREKQNKRDFSLSDSFFWKFSE